MDRIRVALWFSGLLALVTWSELPAQQPGPQLSYAPTPDSVAADPGDPACLAAPVRTVELDFSAHCSPGTPCAVDVTPQVGAGIGTTSLACRAIRVSGNGQVGVQQSPTPFTLPFGGGTQTFFATCAPGSAATVGKLCCQEVRDFVAGKTYPVFDIGCPPIAVPRYVSQPEPGSTLLLQGAPSSQPSRAILVGNDGDSLLTVVPRPLPSPFDVQPPSLSVAPGSAPVAVTVSCVVGSDAVTGELVLDTNDPTRSTPASAILFPIQCVPETQTAPPLPRFNAAPPAPIATPQGVQGSTELVVSNTGNATLELSAASASPAPPFSVAPPGATIQPGATASFIVSCLGNAAGQFNGVVAFGSNDPDENPATVGVNCTISATTAPGFDSTPAPPGPISLSTPQLTDANGSLVVRNSGDAQLVVLSAGLLAGSSPNLSVTPTSSTAIIPGDTRTFTVRCTAAAAGAFAGTLRLDTTAGTFDYGVACGVNAAATPRFTSQPVPGTTISFTTQTATPQPRTLVIGNIGSANLTVSTITGPAGPQVARSMPSLPLVVAPGTNETLTLTCNSALPGNFNDQIVVSSNDASVPSATYPLSCVVAGPQAAPQAVFSPTSPGLLSLSTRQGIDVTTTLSVANTGNAPLLVSAFANVQSPFSVSPASATIAPGSSASFALRCDAESDGSFARSIAVATNAPGQASVPFNLACHVEFVPKAVTLTAPLIYGTAGLGPAGKLTVGDFDLDGTRDVAIITATPHRIELTYGTGSGGFRPNPTLLGIGSAPGVAVASGTLSVDPRVDFAIAKDADNTVTLQRSVVFFGPYSESSVSMGVARDVALGRLTTGSVDTIVTTGVGAVSLRLDAIMTGPPQTIPIPGTAEAVVVGDADQDGDGDIVVALTTQNEVGLLRGNGAGVFLPLESFGAGGAPQDLKLADFDRDGRIDVAVAIAATGQVAVLPGTPTGFGAPRAFSLGNVPFALEVADLNRDERADIVAAGGSSVALLLGRGDGTFVPAVSFATGGSTQGLGVADYDGDNVPDVIAGLAEGRSFALLLNGPGRFLPATVQVLSGAGAGLVAARLDGNATVDVAAANVGASRVEVLAGNGDGTLQAPAGLTGGTNTYDVSAADFNGDGIIDLLSAEQGSAPSLFLGTGGGQFAGRAPVAGVAGRQFVVVGDLTGDARPDAVFTGPGGTVLRWDVATTSFQPLTTIGAASSRTLVTDLDGDGDLDIALPNTGGASNAYFNQGAGTFVPGFLTGSARNAFIYVADDFNLDGKRDVASLGFGSVSVLLGDGSGSYAAPTASTSLGLQELEAATADVNGDRRPDLLVTLAGASGSPGYLGLLLGNGDGTLQRAQRYPAGIAPQGLAVADFNADEAPDVAVTDSATGAVLIRLNSTQNYGRVFANGFE